MAEFTKGGKRIISLVRVIEYTGTDEWIKATLLGSRIPPQGQAFEGPKSRDGQPFPEGCSIKSGLVVWNIEEPIAEEPSRPLIPIPPGSTSIQ